jgi:DMSO/TMAO reductase YedYZ heme-binding membrane subunit
MTSSTLVWYVARAGGLVSWGLLTLAVLWGLAMSTKAVRRWAKPNWMLDLHRSLAGLAAIFVGVHVGAILLDTYVHFGLANALVPFTGSWHPDAVAWGIISMYLLAAVELTSLARRRLSNRLWRRVHYLSFPLFVLATTHGFSAGTDRANMVVIAVAAAAIVAVTALVGVRLGKRAPVPGPRPTRPAGRLGPVGAGPAARPANAGGWSEARPAAWPPDGGSAVGAGDGRPARPRRRDTPARTGSSD